MHSDESQTFDARSFLAQLTEKPGVYQMFDANGQLLYVGKAKNLKKRVGSYFRSRGLTNKTLSLVRRIARIDVTVTATETEALLLEHNLIKQHRPPFNILLRDDKSYPYIFLSAHKYPRIEMHRGAKREKGTYYGPFPNAYSVKESLNLLQKVFKVRQCDDTYFSNRTRACLQYQIKRCSGPCMHHVSDADYEEQVEHTRLFLEGKGQQLMADIARRMEAASSALEFEKAAEYRDQLQHLKKITEQQFIESGNDHTDVIALSVKAGMACVHVLFIRGGRMIGSRSYYPKPGVDADEGSLLQGFLGQFYLGNQQREIPKRIILPFMNKELSTLAEAFCEVAKRKVAITTATRGRMVAWFDLALNTAKANVDHKVAGRESLKKRFLALQSALSLDALPERIECFDISHSSGESTKASCVVFDRNGPVKADYRQFSITGVTGGDDYAAMEQALRRRFERLVKGEGKKPSVLLIDGGKGQLHLAEKVLTDLGLTDIILIGVAKGASRRAGFEQLIPGFEGKPLVLQDDSEALHLIQHVRDEAHRFAVKSHSGARDKKRRQSALEGIPGVGAKRRKSLLHHFGSVKSVKEAPVRELVKAPGISEKIAEDIYAHFHKE